MSDTDKHSGRAIIEDGAIVIRIPLEYLDTIVEGAWAASGIDVRYRITDRSVFAQELTHSLNAEEEDGTTLIHRTFDAAINDAIEQGAQGIEEHEDQDA
jgi:hypothetical protein